MALTKDEIKEFKKKEKEAENCTGFSIIASGLSYAGDKEWAKNVYKKAEEKADDFYDLRNLADSIFNDLGDEEWSRTLYMKAEEIVDNNFAGLADSIFEHLGDKEWARNLYKKAEEKADDDEKYDLASSMSDYLDDSEDDEQDDVISQKVNGIKRRQKGEKGNFFNLQGTKLEYQLTHQGYILVHHQAQKK